MHLSSAAEVSEETAPVVGHIYAVIAKLAKELGIAAGYRVVNQCGRPWPVRLCTISISMSSRAKNWGVSTEHPFAAGNLPAAHLKGTR